jgi:hypothetical protein
MIAFDKGEIEGAVVSASGAPVPRASVMIARKSPDSCDCTKGTTADELGRFRIPDVVPGDYDAFAARPEDWSLENPAKVMVRGGEKATLTLQLQSSVRLE